MALIFQDTFTDANGTAIDGGSVPQGHAPNLGATSAYRGNFGDVALASVASVQGNRGQFSIGPYTGIFSDFHTIALVEATNGLGNAREVRADVFPLASIEGSIVELLFQYRNNFLASPAAEFYAIQLRRTATPGAWAVYAAYGPYQSYVVPPPYIGSAPRFSPILGTVTAADAGAGVRVGATRYQTTRRYDFWWEPAGGGTRTFLGSFTFPEYADSAHKELGVGITGPAASATTVQLDNLEVDDAGTGDTPAPPSSPLRGRERVLRYAAILATGQGQSYLGNVTASLPGSGSGSETLASGYQSVPGLSCHKQTVTGSAANGFSRGRVASTNDGPINLMLNPVRRRVVRLRDVAMSRVTQFQAGNGKSARILWGMTSDNGASILNPAQPSHQPAWVGFYAEAIETVFGNWFAKVIDKNGTALLDQDLGVSPAAPHSLRLDFDGIRQQIAFYIDEALKASVAIDPASQWYLFGGSSLWHLGMQTHARWVSGVATIVESFYNAAGYGGIWLDEEES